MAILTVGSTKTYTTMVAAIAAANAGDTLEVDVDLGFRVWMRRRLRVLGINAPECEGVTKEAGLLARAAALAWLTEAGSVCVQCPGGKMDSFGRLLGNVFRRADGANMGAWLVFNGYAVPYREQLSEEEGQ